MKVVDAETMQSMDRISIQEKEIPGLALMERAGTGVTDHLCDYFPDTLRSRVAIIAGKGNNGGDGYVVARQLRERGGRATVFLLGKSEDIRGDAKENLDRWKAMEGTIVEIPDLETFKVNQQASGEHDIILDGIFGTGLNSEVRGFYRTIIDFLNGLGKSIVAIDIPSGLNASSGKILGTVIKADLTVTFALPKLGCVLFPGAEYVGKLEVVDIGIPDEVVDQHDVRDFILEARDILQFFPDRNSESHKGDFGHLLIIAGSVGKVGAAALVGHAALRAGCGLVTVAVPRSAYSALPGNMLPELMVEPLPDTPEGTFAEEARESIKQLMEGKTALAVGPGISTHPETIALIKWLVSSSPLPMVIDADGLNCLANDLPVLKNTKAPVILTPHPGEMARLSGNTTSTVQEDRREAARRFAMEWGLYLVLKGARTLVAEPGGTVHINPTGNPGMASAGMGDSLTGIIGGLLAQQKHHTPLSASISGVFLHGMAGDLAASDLGPVGIIASDLTERLPRAILLLSI